jgi:signal peptidase II
MIINTTKEIITGFFNITFVINEGAAWSILTGHTVFLVLAAIIFLNIVFLYLKDIKLTNFEILTYGLLIGGVVGNLIDRVVYGGVIDYLDFTIFNYNFPVFNLADSCIVISAALMIISLKGEQDGNKNR